MRFGSAPCKNPLTTWRPKLAEPLSVQLYFAATAALAPVLPLYLRRRVARAKEHPQRWREKLGLASATRPSGQLIWLHGVGLGEVLALRAMIVALQERDPKLHFLVTSSTVASAETFGKNLPKQTVHQFLPLDTARYARRFFDHWQPDLAIWSEQDIWPGLVVQAARRGIPQAHINIRMHANSAGRRQRAGALYRAIYRHFSLLSAQDDQSAQALGSLGVQQAVRVDGSLKPHSPPLQVAHEARDTLAAIWAHKTIWVAASCHAQDEAIALAAQRQLLESCPDYLLILAPRYPHRAQEIRAHLSDFQTTTRSDGALPDAQTQVYIADSFAEMGLWYSLSDYALIGGTFSAVEGHNPWEALQLGCAVMHGPRTANFAADFAALQRAQACTQVACAADIVHILQQKKQHGLAAYRQLHRALQAGLSDLADALIRLIGQSAAG